MSKAVRKLWQHSTCEVKRTSAQEAAEENEQNRLSRQSFGK